MSIEKKVEICIGTDRAKCVRVRLSLILLEGGVELDHFFHSMTIEPGADLELARNALEEHIATPKGGVPGAPWPAIPDAEWERAVQHIAIEHTPEVVADFAAARESLAAKQA